MNKEELINLIARIADRTATDDEITRYNNWCDRFRKQHVEVPDVEAVKSGMLQFINEQIDGEQPVRKTRLWPRIAAVAAAVAAIMFGVWFFKNEVASSRKAPGNDEWVKNDIAPGRNGATLTLANGNVIQLSDGKSGLVIGSEWLAYSDGEVLRDALGDKGGVLPSGVSRDLTASTSPGQTYIFTLPDGTRVWLNADSKISFPSQFSGKERKVLLEGEGYFEVAKNKGKPFIVQSKAQRVEVLGTHFNINSYADEGATKTTLLEGSVRVAKAGASMVLKPNQQSIVTGSERIVVKEVEVSEAVAWKNGEFMFDSEPLESVMRKIGRWYDVEVIYEKESLKNIVFNGSMSRYDNVLRILKTIEFTGNVKFKLAGRKIYVSL